MESGTDIQVSPFPLNHYLDHRFLLGNSDMDRRPYEAEAASGGYCIDGDDDCRAGYQCHGQTSLRGRGGQWITI